MAGSSNPPHASPPSQDMPYLYASNANVSNFVSVKLSDNNEYRLWKAQMLCLMETHNMRGIVDHTFVGPTASTSQIMRQYDSLLKGRIFGSLNKDVLGTVVDLDSAEAVWKKLQSIYDPLLNSQQDSSPAKQQANTRTDVQDVVSVETETKGKDKKTLHNKLRKAIEEEDFWQIENIPKDDKDAATEAISSDGNTMLHIAVGIGNNDVVVKLLNEWIKDGKALETRNSDGSTTLHVAAIVGNKYAANLLVKKHDALLRISDDKGHVSLLKAYYSMQLDTFVYLLEKQQSHPSGLLTDDPSVETGVKLLVNAISARQYTLASKLVKKYPELAVKNDFVLMAIARTFPSGLDFGEAFLYPCMFLIVVLWILLPIYKGFPSVLSGYK